MQGSLVLFNLSRVFLEQKNKKKVTADRTVNGALAQLARASALQAECQGFESLKLHQFFEFKLLFRYGACLVGKLPKWAYSSVG